MDALTALLEGPRARGAFALRACFDPPWAVRIEDEAPLSVMVMLRGGAWITPEGGAPQRLEERDIAVARGPAPYVCADDPGTAPRVRVLPDGRCATMDGRPTGMDLGVRTWGDRPEGEVTVLIGTYQMAGEVNARLLAALPPLLTLSHHAWDCPYTQVLGEEIVREQPGQDVVLDRLFDLLVISALRVWFARPEGAAPAWYRALGDPVVGPVLRLLQEEPERPWTVASLAARAGVSRAALARRFTTLVGEPPMAYLTGWRLARAADLLRGSERTLAAVAREVGYSTAFALSAAFKRVYGTSPSAYRTLRHPAAAEPAVPLPG